MSSHREAPEISKDPVADSTDLYAFVSPDQPGTVTLIANYIPLQPPAGGPNFYEFGSDVLYEISIDNTGDGIADIVYQFTFTTTVANPESFLYNSGPIGSLTDPNWNRRQTYTVTRVAGGQSTVLASNLPCPPCNIGPLSTPNYAGLATAAINTLPTGERVFAGQRAEGFYVDLGAIFDLGDLRPFQQLHAHFGLNVPELTRPSPGLNAGKGVNVHTIAIQVPKTMLTSDGSNPTDPSSPKSVIGVWTAARRQQVRMYAGASSSASETGPFVQVSRLGNPLINEVVIPLGDKDNWNVQPPSADSQFAKYYTKPELAQLLPILYPNVFPNLAALNSSGKPRADLVAVLLTGIPSGIIPGFQNNTGSTQADMLRLNMAIPPASSPSTLGLLGNDAAGFPNGRRVFDDVVTIELRAVAGATYALVDNTYKPDAAAGAVTQGLTSQDTDTTARGTANYLPSFPYLGQPYSGYDVPADNLPTALSSY
ncbi:MAG TPA: DUF4331 domain-containing protein [Acidimicrobiales bacterium]|nr:DUF4331 domain-containing protein [Acidimicrobiales bacterium]